MDGSLDWSPARQNEDKSSSLHVELSVDVTSDVWQVSKRTITVIKKAVD